MSRRMNDSLKFLNILTKHLIEFRSGTSTYEAILKFPNHTYTLIDEKQSLIAVSLTCSRPLILCSVTLSNNAGSSETCDLLGVRPSGIYIGSDAVFYLHQ